MLKMLWISLLWLVGVGAGEPLSLYLSWVRDPTTTMVVQWHTVGSEDRSEVLYQRQGEAQWRKQGGESQKLEGVDRRIHRVELQGLQTGTEYAFRVGDNVHRFKTMPGHLERPVKFVVGGDIFHETEENFAKMNRAVAKKNPDFVVLGGDLAYTHSAKKPTGTKEWQLARWDLFFKHCENELVTEEGRMIPLVAVVGNHDVTRFDTHDLFYEIFAFPEKNVAYRTLDFGSYLQLILLDSAHTYPVDGKQTQWLEGVLREREEMLYRLPIYHVSAFPAYYAYTQKIATTIRENWVPLFEKFGIQVVFEHHNHVYKRTHPLKGGKVDPEGIVYLGDGSWGINPREAKNSQVWYIAEAKGVNAVFFVTLDGKQASIEPISHEGQNMDVTVKLDSYKKKL